MTSASAGIDVGYRLNPLPDFVREPWKPGELFDMTESARAFHASEAEIKVLVGGLGSAKTTTAAHEAVFLGCENLGCVGLVVEPTYQLARDIFVPAFIAALEESGLERGKHWVYKQTEATFLVLGGAAAGGFTVLLRTAEHPERIVGINAAWALVDEPALVPRSVLTQVRQRVRDPRAKRRCIGLTGTPNPGTWFVAFLKQPAGNIEVFVAPTAQNPYISQEYLDALAAELDPVTFRALAGGELVSPQGNAYHSFKEAPFPVGNLRSWTYQPSRPVILTLDNNRAPMCGAMAQLDGSVIQWFATIKLRSGSWGTFADAVAHALKDTPPAGMILSGDAYLRGQITDESTDWGQYADLHAHLQRVMPGLRVTLKAPRANPRVADRLLATNTLLCNAKGERRVAVDPSCIPLIEDWRSMETDEEGELKKPGTKAGKGVDPDRSHTSDAVDYFHHQHAPVKHSSVRRMAVVSAPLPPRR